MERELTIGLMVNSIKESELIIKCMGKAYFLIRMEENMMGNIKTTRKTDMGFSNDRMELGILACGLMKNKMVNKREEDS